MIIIVVEEVLAALKAHTAHGKFKNLIISSEGKMSAVYETGIIQFDKDGKIVKE